MLYDFSGGPGSAIGTILIYWKQILWMLIAAGIYREYGRKRLRAKIMLLYDAPAYRLHIDGKRPYGGYR